MSLFPDNCGHCGWQLHPAAVWLAIGAALGSSSAAGVPQLRAVVDAELARARLAEESNAGKGAAENDSGIDGGIAQTCGIIGQK